MTYSTDTRTLRPGETYVAIRGEVYDGHDFIADAVAQGAAAVVTERDLTAEEAGDADVIRVESALDFLTTRASAALRQSGADVVAITGSVGKTTTKTALVAVLREAFPVAYAEGNLNTPLGLSLSVLNQEAGPDTKWIMEMGARLAGDIRELCALFPPTVSVVTTVRGVHLETFGSLDAIEAEKGELVAGLRPGGTAVLNADDDRVRRMADRHAGPALLYGLAPDADIRPEHVTAELPILGDHAVHTALAATAAGRALGMGDAAINRGLAQIEPEKGRLAKLRGRGGSVLIDDTYNASPEATRSALRVLAGLDAERRIALLGDMLELGEDEIAAHVDVLEAAAETADLVVAVGPLMAEAAGRLGPDARARVETAETSAALAEAVASGEAFTLGSGDAVLVKGSQGVRMERVSAAALHLDLDPADVLPRQSLSWRQKD